MANAETPQLTLSTISSAFTPEVLQLVVRRALKDRSPDAAIAGHEVRLGTEKGDGYIGIVYRILVRLTDGGRLSLIGKGLPANLVRRRTYNCEGYFEKEVVFFNEYAPLLKEFEASRRGAAAVSFDSFLPIAECYYALHDGVNDFLVFQDLKEIDFDMADRLSGLTDEQRSSNLSTMARFHALSLAFKVAEPEKFAKLNQVPEPWFIMDKASQYSGYMFKMYNLWHRAIKDALAGTDCLRRFEALGPDQHTLFEKICNSLQVLEPCVVTHGDTWATNFMFRSTQVAMIDFQMARISSAMTDLSVFVFACTTEPQRTAAGGTNAILRTYYGTMQEALHQLGVQDNPLTWERMMEQWRVNGLNGLACALELVPMSLVKPEEVQDLDRVQGDEHIDLAQLSQLNEVIDPQGKQRLVDLTNMAMYYDII